MMTTRALLVLSALLLLGCNDDGPPGLRDQRVGGGDALDGPASPVEARPGGERRPGEARAYDGPIGAASACGALPPPSGAKIDVTPAQAGQLPSIVAGAASGTTILLADGSYVMQGGESQRRLTFSKPGVTLRSASGDRSKVIIDGEYVTAEIIFIQTSDVVIADLTIKRAVDHLVHVVGNAAGVKKVRLRNLYLVDGGEQFVKVNGDGQGHFVDEGLLECSTLEMTAAGRPHVESGMNGCYTGGIDAHGAWKWQVRENTFKGIYCTNGALAEHAVHFWSASRDTLVERNLIVDCARGVGFGLGDSGATRPYPDNPYPSLGYKGHIDGIIRNNVIHDGAAAAPYYDTGIELQQAAGVRVYHNTIASKPLFSSIDYRFANTQAEIRNNLTFKITLRDGAKGTVDHNLEAAPASLFVNANGVDYHLVAGASAAIDKGVAVAEGGLDLDGRAHDVGAPDLGAYERRP